MNEVVLMAHVLFGVGCIITTVWLFVDVLHASDANLARIRKLSVAAAVFPDYWINEFLGLSETIVLLFTAAVILVAVKLWRAPSLRLAAALGLLCGLAADTRAEQVLLLPLVLAPVLLFRHGLELRRRIGFTAVGGLAALLVIAPWVGFNMSRFSHRVIFSTDSGQTLAMANCRSTYYRTLMGSGDFNCINRIKAVPGDESAQNAQYEKVAKAYINAHTDRLPFIVFARVGREFAFYTPMGELIHENYVNHRPLTLAEIGLGMYYAMAAASLYGAVVLWRRRVTIVPFVGILAELVVTAAATYGQTRYRAPFEVVLVVLTGVGVDALLARRSPVPGARVADPAAPEAPARLAVR